MKHIHPTIFHPDRKDEWVHRAQERYGVSQETAEQIFDDIQQTVVYVIEEILERVMRDAAKAKQTVVEEVLELAKKLV